MAVIWPWVVLSVFGVLSLASVGLSAYVLANVRGLEGRVLEVCTVSVTRMSQLLADGEAHQDKMTRIKGSISMERRRLEDPHYGNRTGRRAPKTNGAAQEPLFVDERGVTAEELADLNRWMGQGQGD